MKRQYTSPTVEALALRQCIALDISIINDSDHDNDDEALVKTDALPWGTLNAWGDEDDEE